MCFMECVFEDQGFLVDKRINKDALHGRLNNTLGRNEVWHKVASQALETCHETELAKIPANSTCQSGSEEIFRCVFKQIFFNCPTWPQRNQYCSALKEFYQKCPDGPPPELDETQTASAPKESEEESKEEDNEETEEESPSTEGDIDP